MSYFLSVIPPLLFGTGLFFILRLRGFFLLHPIRCIRLLFTKEHPEGISPFKALTVALYLGGAGAVLWMLVSALVAMVLKYAEITLALRHRRISPDGHPYGGAPYYIRDGLTHAGLPRVGKITAALFALLCLLNAVTMGSLLQINAVAGAMEEGFSVPPLATGIAVMILTLVTVRGGARRISALTEKLVPLMTVGFLIACLAVLFLRHERIPAALTAIWQDSCSPLSAGAGVGGFLLSKGVRYGTMRGLVSNEAGCGTAPMAHASAHTDLPARQGLFGLVEVFVDTVLLCTVTALCILVSDSGPNACGSDAVRTASNAFSSVLGKPAGGFFALSILFFGVATILCWALYGMTCLTYLSTRPVPKWIYLTALTASLLVGTVTAPTVAWTLADLAIGVMTVFNLLILLLMRREVAEETAKLFPKHTLCKRNIDCVRKSFRKE